MADGQGDTRKAANGCNGSQRVVSSCKWHQHGLEGGGSLHKYCLAVPHDRQALAPCHWVTRKARQWMQGATPHRAAETTALPVALATGTGLGNPCPRESDVPMHLQATIHNRPIGEAEASSWHGNRGRKKQRQGCGGLAEEPGHRTHGHAQCVRKLM